MSRRKPAHMLEKQRNNKRYNEVNKTETKKSKVIYFMIIFNILMIGIIIALSNTTVFSGSDTNIQQTIMNQVRFDLIPGKNIIPYTLSNSEENISVENIKTQFENAGYVVEKIENDNNGKICTGTDFYIQGKAYTIVIYGDVNKDSQVNLLDAQRIVENYLHKENTGLDSIQILAANLDNNDNDITLLDAQRIIELYLQRIEENILTNTVTGIEIKIPYKTEYGLGEDLDLTGGTVTVKYASGATTQTEMLNQMIRGYNKNLEEKQNLTLLYAGNIATFNVTVKDLEPTSFAFNITDGELRPGGDISKPITGLNKSGVQVPLKKSDITVVNNNEQKIEVKLIDDNGYEATQDESPVTKLQIISKDSEAEDSVETISIKVGEKVETITIVLGKKPYINTIEFTKGNLSIKEIGTNYELQGGSKTETIDGINYVLVPVKFKDQYGEPVEVKGNEFKRFGGTSTLGLVIDTTTSMNYFRILNTVKVFQTFNGKITETTGENPIEYMGFNLKDSIDSKYVKAGVIRVYYRATGRTPIYSDINVSIIEDTKPVGFELEAIADKELKPGKEITKTIKGRNALGREIGLKKQYVTVTPNNSSNIEVQLLKEDGTIATQNDDIVSKIKIISKAIESAGTTQSISITIQGQNPETKSFLIADKPYVSTLQLQGANLTISTTADGSTLTGGNQLATVGGVQYVLVKVDFKDQYGDKITVKASEYKRYATSSVNGFVIDSSISGNYTDTFIDKVFRNNGGTIVEAMGENPIEYIGFVLKDTPTYLQNGNMKLIYRTTNKPEVTASITITNM